MPKHLIKVRIRAGLENEVLRREATTREAILDQDYTGVLLENPAEYSIKCAAAIAIIERIAQLSDSGALKAAIAAIDEFDREADAENADFVLRAFASRVHALFKQELAATNGTFNLGALAIPVIFAQRGIPVDTKSWSKLAEELTSSQGPPGPPLVLLLRLLVMESIAHGPNEALGRLVFRLAKLDIQKVFDTGVVSAKQLGTTLAHFGWYREPSSELARALAIGITKARRAGYDSFAIYTRTMAKLLAFQRGQPFEWLKFLAEHLLLPQIQAAAEDSTFADMALEAELWITTLLIETADTEDTFAYAYSLIGPALVAAGKTLALRHPLGPLKSPMTAATPRIAFYLLGDFKASHAPVFYLLLRGLKSLDSRPIDPIIYISRPPAKCNFDILTNAVQGLDVVIRHPDRSMSRSESLLWVRERAALDGVLRVGIRVLLNINVLRRRVTNGTDPYLVDREESLPSESRD